MDVETRKEYDFSGGIRGRRAARMTTEDRDGLLTSAAVQDVQAWIAHSLIQVQAFEAALFAYFMLAENDSTEQAVRRAATLFDRGEARSLDQLLVNLRHRGLSDEELGDRLTWLVEERNWLVHRSGYESQIAAPTSERTLLLLGRLEKISGEAYALKAQFDHLVEQHLSNHGFSRHEIDNKTDEAADLWLAA